MAQSKSKKLRKELRKGRDKIKNWSGGDRCPICKKSFRGSSCPHGLGEAKERLEEDLLLRTIQRVVEAEVQKAVAEILAR